VTRSAHPLVALSSCAKVDGLLEPVLVGNQESGFPEREPLFSLSRRVFDRRWFAIVRVLLGRADGRSCGLFDGRALVGSPFLWLAQCLWIARYIFDPVGFYRVHWTIDPDT
jgi:hypothetical protein